MFIDFMPFSGPEGENCLLSVKDYLGYQHFSARSDVAILHIMIVSTDREREAALGFRI